MKHRIVCLLGLVFFVSGCGEPSGFETYFVPEDMEKEYHPVEKTRVIRVGVKNPEEMKKKHYPDAVLIGTSEFIGPPESESSLEDFAEDIGADVVIWYSRWIKSITTTGYHYYTDLDTCRYRRGRPVTVMTERVEPYTITTHLFEHAGLFLRTKNAVNRDDDDDDDKKRKKKKKETRKVEGKEILEGETK